MFECECCALPICAEKSKGIGYVCEDCLDHYVLSEAVGRPGWPTAQEHRARTEADHAALYAIHGTPAPKPTPDTRRQTSSLLWTPYNR